MKKDSQSRLHSKATQTPFRQPGRQESLDAGAEDTDHEAKPDREIARQFVHGQSEMGKSRVPAQCNRRCNLRKKTLEGLQLVGPRKRSIGCSSPVTFPHTRTLPRAGPPGDNNGFAQVIQGSSDVILSELPDVEAVFSALDTAGLPANFMSDQDRDRRP